MDTINYDLTDRTLGEEIWLWRRRQPALNGRAFGKIGATMSQEEAASILGIDYQLLVGLEEEESAVLDRTTSESLVAMLTGAPTPGELCRLARRRSGLTLDEAAAGLNISKVTLHPPGAYF